MVCSEGGLTFRPEGSMGPSFPPKRKKGQRARDKQLFFNIKLIILIIAGLNTTKLYSIISNYFSTRSC